MTRNVRVAVVASAQIFGGFQNLPPPQSLDFSAFFGLSHLFPPRLSISVIFDTDLVTLQLRSAIEGGALIRLGRRHSDADMEELRGMMAEFEAASLLSPSTAEVAAALARFHYKICTLSGNQLFPLIMNAFRGVGSVLWESSARFWGEKALYEQGMHIIELIDAGRGEDAANYMNALFDHYLENVSL